MLSEGDLVTDNTNTVTHTGKWSPVSIEARVVFGHNGQQQNNFPTMIITSEVLHSAQSRGMISAAPPGRDKSN